MRGEGYVLDHSAQGGLCALLEMSRQYLAEDSLREEAIKYQSLIRHDAEVAPAVDQELPYIIKVPHEIGHMLGEI